MELQCKPKKAGELSVETAIPSFNHPLLPKYGGCYGGGVEGSVVTIHLGSVRSVSKFGSFPQCQGGC